MLPPSQAGPRGLTRASKFLTGIAALSACTFAMAGSGCTENIRWAILHSNGNVYFAADQTCAANWCQIREQQEGSGDASARQGDFQADRVLLVELERLHGGQSGVCVAGVHEPGLTLLLLIQDQADCPGSRPARFLAAPEVTHDPRTPLRRGGRIRPVRP